MYVRQIWQNTPFTSLSSKMQVSITRIALCFLFCFAFNDCKEKNTEASQELGTLGIINETIIIDLPSSTSANLTVSALEEIKGVEYLASYNYLDHCISLMSLTQRRYLKKIELNFVGPDFIKSVGAIAILSLDSFLIVNDQHLTFIDSNGKVVRRYAINDVEKNLWSFDFSKFVLRYNHLSGLQYDSQKQTILLEMSLLSRGSPQKYKGSVIAEVNIKNLTIVPLNLYIPELYQALKGDYGELVRPGYWRFDEKIIYNFKMSPAVFVNDGKNTLNYLLKGLNTMDVAPPIMDFSDGYNLSRIRHQILSQNFSTIIYDPYRNVYCRTHSVAKDQVDDKQKFYLIIADLHFNILEEVEFLEGYYTLPLMSREGLMFMAFNKHDDRLELINYKLNYN